jgi:hypothetical protein
MVRHQCFSLMSDACRQTVLLVFSGFVAAALRDWSYMSEDARMTGFDAVVRVANLAPASQWRSRRNVGAIRCPDCFGLWHRR